MASAKKLCTQYLTYEEYGLMGGTKDEASFNLLEYKAKSIIRSKTLDRLENLNEYANEVKFCMYELIDMLSFDGNYLDGTLETKRKMENDIIYRNLAYLVINDTPVLNSCI